MLGQATVLLAVIALGALCDQSRFHLGDHASWKPESQDSKYAKFCSFTWTIDVRCDPVRRDEIQIELFKSKPGARGTPNLDQSST
jgi:hypothetical protein